MSVMGNNYMAMDSSSNNLLTFDGTVYAPVTECASYTDYEPSSTAGASSTGNAETDSAETARVQLSIGSNDARQFSVPTDNSIFVLVNDVGVQADRFEVLTGPEGVTCTVCCIHPSLVSEICGRGRGSLVSCCLTYVRSS